MDSGKHEKARHAHAVRNSTHSLLLLCGIGVLLALSAWLIWGLWGLAATAVAVVALALTAPRVPPRILMRLYRARIVESNHGGELSRILATLAERAELDAVPDLYIIPSLAMNAFATGSRGTAAIALTEGLLRRLELREIASVLAHEVSHIAHNDLRVMSLADLMSRFMLALSYAAAFLFFLNIFHYLTAGEAYYSWFGIGLLYAGPAVTSLMQLGLSRTREYSADLGAVQLTGDPEGLVLALSKLERYTGSVWEDLMFPVPGRRIPQPSVLRSHPTTEERVARLKELEADHGLAPLAVAKQPFISLAGVGPISMRPRYRFPGLWY